MKVKPKFKVVKIDETKNWREDIVEKSGKIFGIYLYDESRQTRCCEITPSYEMHFLNSMSENHIEDEEEREILFDEISEGDIHTERVSYFHVSSIDKLSGKNVYSEGFEIDEEEYETEENYKTLVEDTIGEEMANPTFC
jgi:hypothetical protein